MSGSEEEVFTLNELANENIRKKIESLKCTKNCADHGDAISMSIKGEKLYCALCETDDQDMLKVSLKSCLVPVRSLIRGSSKIDSYCDKAREEIAKRFKRLRVQFDNIEQLMTKKCVQFIRLGGVTDIINLVKKSTFQKQNLQVAKNPRDILKSLKGVMDANNLIKKTNIETLEKEQSLNILEFIEKVEKQISLFFTSLKNNELRQDERNLLEKEFSFKEQLLKDSQVHKAVLVSEEHYRKLIEQLQTIKNCESLRIQKTVPVSPGYSPQTSASSLASQMPFSRLRGSRSFKFTTSRLLTSQSGGLCDSEIEQLTRLKAKRLRRVKLANCREGTKRRFDAEMLPRLADRMQVLVENWLH